MTLAEIAGAVGGAFDGAHAERTIDGFSIDTRSVQTGDLFFAIRGDRFDGHTFVAEAARKGASAAIVSSAGEVRAAAPELPLVVVDDSIAALQRLATYVRRESGTTVVAVTGSAGKSTTKEIAAEFLAARYRVFRNKGNLNNHIGLPLSLLELRRKPDVAVVELGMNHAGEISALVKIADPNVRVWTNVAPAHLEFFGTVDAIADAKAEILERARSTDLLVANADDDRVMRHAGRFAGRVLTFGMDRVADVRAEQVRDLGVDGTAAHLRTPAGEVELETALPGTANLSNILAATAVALDLQVPLASIVERAAALKPVTRRGEVIRAGDLTIVDDSYNSNPKALARALEWIGRERRYTRRVAVIGEMLELGPASGELHRESGRQAAQAGIDHLIAVGGAPAKQIAEGALEAGMPAGAVQYVADSRQAAEIAVALVRPGDLVLVKGSRGTRTDIVADRLKSARA